MVGAWLRLFRLPNLLTVPGDVLVGYWLVGGWTVPGWTAWASVGAGLGLYAIGLLVNDWVDREEDRRLRPDRPLAAGQIEGRAVGIVFGVLWLGTLAALVAAGFFALLLGTLVLSLAIGYSVVFRRQAVLGIAALGFCRMSLILLGALAAGKPVSDANLALACLTNLGWIVLVSGLARDEADRDRLRPAFHPRWLAGFVVGMGMMWLVAGEFQGELGRVLFGVLGVLIALLAWLPAGRFWALAEGRPVMIGRWLGLLILLQVWMVLPVVSWVQGLALIGLGGVLWGIRGWLARFFAAS